MKVNWGALGITIGLILVAASISVMGLMTKRTLTGRLTTLEKQIPIMRAAVKRNIIAQGYAFRKAESEKRTISVEDLREGYTLADEFMKE